MNYLLIVVVIVVVMALLLFTKSKDKSEPIPDDMMNPQAWEVGPIYDGVNVSTGVALHPIKVDGGWAIDIPLYESGSVHYVTMPTGSLAGKTKVTLVCELVMADGLKLRPVKSPDSPSLLTLYFQRSGDNWTSAGKYEAYRWYASFATQSNLSAREYTIEARFDDNWTAIMSSSRLTHPEAFADALANAGRIGFVLGGGDGLGHGVYATGPARLIVKSFAVT